MSDAIPIWLHTTSADAAAAAPDLTAALAARDLHVEITVTAAPGSSFMSDAITPLDPDVQNQIRQHVSKHAPRFAIIAASPLPEQILRLNRGLPKIILGTGRPVFRQRRLVWPGTRADLLNDALALFVPNEAEAVIMRSHGGIRIQIAEPLRPSANALNCTEAERSDLAGMLNGRPVWLAAGAHLGEIDLIAEAHARVCNFAHRLLLIVAPAEISEAPEMLARLRTHGIAAGLRSDGDEPEPQISAYVADLEGEMGLWYRLAPVSYLGGTLSGTPAPAPFDAAALGSAIVHGTSLTGHRDQFTRLREARATCVLDSPEALAVAIDSLISPVKAADLAEAAWKECTGAAETVTQLADICARSLGP